MSWLAQLGHAAVVAAALLSSAGPTGRYPDRGLQQASDFQRVLDLMKPLARAVLASADREELEFNIDEQLFSGLFSDLVSRSIQAVARQSARAETDDLDEQFVLAVERLGGERAAVRKAWGLAQISTQISIRLIEIQLAGSEASDELESLSRFDMHEFLYDIETPLELRDAAQADFESAICMIALAYAVAANEEPPAWLVTELVGRWLVGQAKSLPLMTAIAIDRGVRLDEVLSDNLRIRLDQLNESEGFDLRAQAEQAARDLATGQKRAETMSSQLRVIAEHASRQPDGVWPKK